MKVVVFTLGCKTNQYESDGLILKLIERGYEVSTEIVPADIYILNSCAVTNEAEKKSRQTIAKFKEQNPNAKILVCGCASQKNPNQFKDISGVTFVSGTADKVSIVDSLLSDGIYLSPIPVEYNEKYIVMPTKTRAYIKIQDGCNNFCTYCIIPYLRGRSRSRDLDDIVSEVKTLSKQAKEIVITGINITDYKIEGKPAFDVLLNRLKEFTGIRIRLGSIEKGLIEKDFVKSIIGSNICPHFHMSLQSGCDTVLKRMNRKYTTQLFLNSVELIKSCIPDACITTDVIVGFPGETDEEFRETCEFVKRVGFYNIHIFPYSQRSGTVAEKMQQVNGTVKKERVKILSEINKELNKKYIENCKNKVFTMLTEEQVGEYTVGHTENYLKCYLKGEANSNEFVKVKVLEPFNDGVLVKKEN